MTIWVLWCWALDARHGEWVSKHPTLDAAVHAALAWVEANRHLRSRQRGVYTVVEADAVQVYYLSPSHLPSGRSLSPPTAADQ